MKFQLGNSEFLIEFEREHRNIQVNRSGSRLVKTSKYPYTTVRLIERPNGAQGRTAYTASVGCLPTDKYSNAAGRLAAMRKLSAFIATKELRAAMWDAYLNRAKQPQKA